jgi:hypothetical protein
MSFNSSMNVSNVSELMTYNNEVTDGLFGYSILFAFWLVSFAIASRFRVDHAVTSASFVTFIAATLLLVMGIVEMGAVLISLGVTLVSYVIAKM